jgi:hypothetical protein
LRQAALSLSFLSLWGGLPFWSACGPRHTAREGIERKKRESECEKTKKGRERGRQKERVRERERERETERE